MRVLPGNKPPTAISLLFFAIVLPPLWLGGVSFASQVVFALLVMAALGILVAARTPDSAPEPHPTGRGLPLPPKSDSPRWRIPAGWWLPLVLAGVTLLGCIPLSPGIHARLAPGLWQLRLEALGPAINGRWHPLSLLPSQALLESARLIALAGLFIACAALRRKRVLVSVLAAGVLSTAAGLVGTSLGDDQVAGMYVPIDRLGRDLLPVPAFTGTFVNPNHQASLLLLALGAGAALLRDLASDAKRGRLRRDQVVSRGVLLTTAVSICSAGMIASYSRAAILGGAFVVLWALISVGRISGVRRTLVSTAPVLAIIICASIVARIDPSVLLDDLGSLATREGYFKIGILRQHLELVTGSPIVGLGRGSSTELLSMTTDVPPGMTVTHIESIPICLAVEYGPITATGVIVAMAAWAAHAARHARGSASITVVTILALLLQNGVDFSLDFLGTAAPATAMMSTVTSTTKVHVRPSTSRRVWLAVVGTLFLILICSWSSGGGWASARARSAALLRDGASGTEVASALVLRPFDARLHYLIAREHLAGGENKNARDAALRATAIEPHASQAHLLLAAANANLGDSRAADAAYAAALRNIIQKPPESLIQYLIEVLTPARLARATPASALTFQSLGPGLLQESPRHALAFARRRAFAVPPDPNAVALRVHAASRLGEDLIAQAEARRLRRLRPEQSRSYTLSSMAARVRPTPQAERQLQTVLRAALGRPSLESPRLVSLLLLESLAKTGPPRELRVALETFEELSPREGDPRGGSHRAWRARVLDQVQQHLVNEPAGKKETSR